MTTKADRRAAQIFPEEWARWKDRTGRQAQNKRHKLRKDALRESILQPLRKRGACCESCTNYEYSSSLRRMTCPIHSEGMWTSVPEPDHLCEHWKGATDDG